MLRKGYLTIQIGNDMKLHEYLLLALQEHNLDIDSLPINKKYWHQFVKNINEFISGKEADFSALTSANNKLSEDLKAIEKIGHLGFWSLDLKTNQLFWSKEIYFLLGLDYVKEKQNQSETEIFNLVHPEDRDNYTQLMDITTSAKPKKETEIRILNSEGKYKWFYVTGEKTLHAFSGIFMDITEQKESDFKLIISKKNLLKSETLFREFAEKINDVFWRVTPSMDKTIYVSPAFKKIWGISVAEVYRNPQAWSNSIHSDDKEKVLKAFLTDIKHKSSVAVEFRIIRPNGSIRHIYSRGFPLKDKMGNLVSLLGIATDITKYKEEQQYLLLTKEVTLLLEHTNDLKKVSYKILRLICNTFDWDYGEIWLMDFSANKLRNLNYWSNPKVEDLAFNLKSQEITFKPGINLPGKVFQDKKHIWIEDILNHSDLIRTNEAIHADLNSALGVPIIFHGKILGVIDFFSKAIVRPNKELLKMLTQISNLFAEFTHRKYTEKQIIHESKHDKLTDFLNRDSFEEQLNLIITKNKSPMIAVLILGVDQHRNTLTSIGYDAADYLILTIAGRLRQLGIQNEDKIARLIPDKFLFILNNLNSMDEVLNQANTILRIFHKPFFVKGKELFINPCIGIAMYPQDGENSKVLLQQVSAALDFTKQPYQNNIQFCTKELSHSVMQKISMEGDLRIALSKNELILWYQPQIDLQTGHISGIEALIRWQHPTLGLLLPNDFIPLAEEMGLITDVDKWVLKEVWAQIDSGWPSVPISVNVSAHHFKKHFKLLSFIKNLNKQYTIKPHQVEFEVTESQYLKETVDSIEILKYLNDEGFGIALDDFGTGFSSLQYLLNIPLQKIKIDKSFIDNITSDTKSISIVNSLILLAHSLEKKVIAEGVETLEQLKLLRQLECDEVQGYYFFKPVDLEEIKSLLKNNKEFNEF